MRKLLLLFSALALVGAGCVEDLKTVEGDWYLAFELPGDWVMVPPYSEGESPIDLGGVSVENSEIYLQSSSKHMIFDEDKVVADKYIDMIGEVLRDNMTRISVLKLSSHRLLPEEAEDLGNGFYKNGEDYYYVASDGEKYLFMVEQKDQDISVAENIIFSAQEVTINQE